MPTSTPATWSRSGSRAADAQRVADTGMAESFPQGRPRPGHAVLDVVDAGESRWATCGSALPTVTTLHAWWVWDVVVDQGRRGQGLGRAAMVLAEDYATSHGARTLGLSVFGFNVAARRLYESLGYDTTSVKMSKRLGATGPHG